MTEAAKLREIHADARRELMDIHNGNVGTSAGRLNLREVGWSDVMTWWKWRQRTQPRDPACGAQIEDFDILSVLDFFEEWVKNDLPPAPPEPEKNYVVGLLFRTDASEVLLIEKQRPSWQKGALNGPGGHVEPGETADEAMRREYREETGIDAEWEKFCVMDWSGGRVSFYKSYGNHHETQPTDERLFWKRVDQLGSLTLVDGLSWLIPLALHNSNQHVTYTLSPGVCCV